MLNKCKIQKSSTPPRSTNYCEINTKVLSKTLPNKTIDNRFVRGKDLGEGYARRVETNVSTTLTPSPTPRERVAKGFTLAETLITLVIIGVVAALTVPTLIVRYQKEQTVIKLKKAYVALSQTTKRAIADNGPIKTWELNTANNADEVKTFVNKYIAPYLNLSVPAKTLTEGNWNIEKYLLNGNASNYTDKYALTYLSV